MRVLVVLCPYQHIFYLNNFQTCLQTEVFNSTFLESLLCVRCSSKWWDMWVLTLKQYIMLPPLLTHLTKIASSMLTSFYSKRDADRQTDSHTALLLDHPCCKCHGAWTGCKRLQQSARRDLCFEMFLVWFGRCTNKQVLISQEDYDRSMRCNISIQEAPHPECKSCRRSRG